jgi:hypothetical protein
MSSIIVSGDTSGAITIAAPAVSGTNTLTLPASTGTVALTGAAVTRSQLPTGSVLQVLQTTKTDTFTTTSTSYVDITGFSITITPTSATSKIFVMYNMEIGGANATDANHVYLQLYRGSTAIFIADTAGSRTSATSVANTPVIGTMYPSNCAYLDSPATTSSTTYKVQIKTSSASYTACVNRSGRDNDAAAYDGRAVSSITLMEIAA